MFNLKKELTLSGNMPLQVFEDDKTGMMHYHFVSQNPENSFFLVFKTVPECDNGVAHVLEHTALCGSEKYPVRDPFFMMSRRSVNTFMNALTSNDWTGYPFATACKKDFDNLTDVYLDSAFFPNLSEMDFIQEGCRIDFKDSSNPSAGYAFNGVVFNEMKGAMSPAFRRLYQAQNSGLAQGSNYANNSGGEPLAILDLTHQDLLDFHAKHYHPSNAMLFTFGDLGADYFHDKLEADVLPRFEYRADAANVSMGERISFEAPQKVETAYAFKGANPEKNAWASVSWLFEEVRSVKEVLALDVLTTILSGNDASPISTLVRGNPQFGVYQGAGFVGYIGAYAYSVYVSNLKEGQEDALEEALLQRLLDFKNEVTPELITDVIKSKKRLLLNVESSSLKSVGLGLADKCIEHLWEGHSIEQFGDNAKLLDELAVDLVKEGALAELIQRWFIDNRQRQVTLAKADPSYTEKQAALEEQKLQQRLSEMTDDEREQIAVQSAALKRRQDEKEDESCLPTLAFTDLPEPTPLSYYAKEVFKDKLSGLYAYQAKTVNAGLVEVKVRLPLPKLSETQLKVLPYYVKVVTELGAGEDSYESVAEEQSKLFDFFMASIGAYTVKGSSDDISASVNVGMRFLAEDALKVAAFVARYFSSVRFDEKDRIKTMLQEMMASKKSGLSSNGHSYMMSASSTFTSAYAYLQDMWYGPQAIADLVGVFAQDEQGIDQWIDNVLVLFADIHQQILKSKPSVMYAAGANEPDFIAKDAEAFEALLLPTFKTEESSQFSWLTSDAEGKDQLWLINGEANYIVQTYQAVFKDHPDSPKLAVLASYLKNTVVHKEVREKGGAYGGHLSYDAAKGALSFASYRDPNMLDTLKAFSVAVGYLSKSGVNADDLDQAKFSVLSAANSARTNTPFGAAKSQFASVSLPGIWTDEDQMAYLEEVKKVTVEDLIRVAETYLEEGTFSYALAVTPAHLEKESIADLEEFTGCKFSQHSML